MTKWKKAVSAGLSAAMLASLLATAFAPAAFAAAGSTSVTGPVSIGPDSTSAAAITINFTEGTSAAPSFSYPAGLFTATIQLFDKNGGSTVSFVGTPVISGAPGSLVATTGFPQLGTGTLANDQLRLSFNSSDTSASEPFTITGLKIKAAAGAPAGAIRMIVMAAAGAGPTSGTITGNTVAAATVVTTAAAHNLTTGNTVTIAGSNSTPSINGTFTVTVLSATTFSIPVTVTVAGTTGSFTGTAGTLSTSLWGNGNLTISAETSAPVIAGATTVPVTASDPTVKFAASGAVTVGGIAGSNGLLVISDGASTESVGVTAANGPPTTSITTNALGFGHPTATAVSQNVVVAGLLASPGSVLSGLIINTTPFPIPATSVQPGENNQAIGGIEVTENAFGTLAVGTVITFKLAPAGVKFSSSPLLHLHNGLNLGNGVNTNTACSLSFDRTSCSVTVTAKTTTLGPAIPAIVLSSAESSQAFVDLDASVAQGSSVTIDVSTSPVLPVKVTDNVVASVSRVIIGVGATPTIYINENDQQSGMLTLTESVAGQFKDASDVLGQNWFGLCQLTGESYTRAPFAVVTVGDLKLRSGAAAATTVLGTLFTGPDPDGGGPLTSSSCVKWQVWSKSTLASTIELRGSDAAGVVLPSGATNGPRLSVPAGLAPGSTQTQVNVGTEAQVNANTVKQTIATNAVRAFRNQPVVAAVTQPVVPKGSTNSLLGCLTITETQAGQFKAGEFITVTILPRSSTTTPTGRQDIFVKQGVTADLPVITTNTASGLLTTSAVVNGTNTAFTFTVTQQATGTLGVITICNIHVISLADAIDGPILVRVTSTAFGQAIDQSVSNGRIGSTVAGSAATRLGVTQVGAFTISTKVAKTGKYVTYRFDFGIGAAGQTVQVWGATKTGNDWSGFAAVTSRVANASGVVYYYIRQNAATWKSYRASWPGGGVMTPARQARWIP